MADQTNAEVSDERLREIIDDMWQSLSDAETISVATELLNRRSVTSQASEGAQAVGVTDHTFAEYEGVTAKELAETVARYGKALSQIAKPTYGTEISDTPKEKAAVYWQHLSALQAIARTALRSTP